MLALTNKCFCTINVMIGNFSFILFFEYLFSVCLFDDVLFYCVLGILMRSLMSKSEGKIFENATLTLSRQEFQLAEKKITNKQHVNTYVLFVSDFLSRYVGKNITNKQHEVIF